LAKLLKMLAIGAVGYAVSKKIAAGRGHDKAANGGQASATPVRDSGPENMRDQPQKNWSKVDEASDQSFPASDPPSTY
jgi:hypothetical protein